MTADESEREKLRDILRAMALDADCVDREVAGPLWEAESRVACGGSMPGLIQWAYWRVRSRVRRDLWTRFYRVWYGFAKMECISADVLCDIAAWCCGNNNNFWRDVDTIVIALCDNPAIPHDLFCELDGRFAVSGGLVTDGENAGGGSVVDELLLGGGGLLLHHDWFPLSVLVCSLVDVFYCSTNTATLSTRVDKSAAVWGAVRRVDTHHSAVVAGVVLTRCCGLAIVGVVNVMRWVSCSRVALSFSPVV